MGKDARIAELEREIASVRKSHEVHTYLQKFVEELADMPEDACLLYTISGQRISHEIGRSARVLRAMLRNGSMRAPTQEQYHQGKA